MKNNKKAICLAITAAILSTSVTPAFAKVVGYVTEKDGVLYQYDKTELKSSIIGDGALYAQYNDGKLKALLDDKKGYIDANDVRQYIINEDKIDVDAYTESDKAEKSTITEAEVKKVDKDGNVIEKPVEEGLKVESVSAINAKQLQITFNNAVEESSVITTGTPDEIKAGVVTVTRTSTDTHSNDVDNALTSYPAELSEDGKTLTITAASNKYFKGNYDVKVSNAVKKGTVDKMENYYGKFVANDTVAPKVTEVTYNVVTDKFEIKLSKPVDSLAGEVLRINGQPVTAGFDAISAPTDKLTVARPADVEPGTTANIYVAGIKDAAGNLMSSYTGNVVVQKDTAALAVNSVEQIQNQKVRVTFNKKLDSTSNTNMLAGIGLVVIKSDGSTTTNFTVAAAPAAENPNDNKYDITLTDATYANGNTENFTITFVEDAFKGVSGTKNKVFTKSITLTKDTVKPVVKSTKVALDKESIEVTLDKAIQTVNQANVKLRRNGAELSNVTASLKTGTNNVVVVKTTDASAVTASKLNAGTYQVRFEEGAVTDLNGNINATTNTPTVTVSGDTTVDPAKATIANGTGDNVFTITAPGTEKFATSSLNYANFVLDGNVIPANSDITLNTARTEITVKLPAKNTVNISGAALLKASNLAFESGNPYATSAATVTVTDNTPATLNSARLLGNVIELTFDEAVNSSKLTDIDAVLADFTIKSDAGTFAKASIASPGPGTDASATVAQGSNDKKIVITITPGSSNWNTVIGGTNLTITSKEGTTAGQVTNLTDTNNVKVKAPVKVSVSK